MKRPFGYAYRGSYGPQRHKTVGRGTSAPGFEAQLQHSTFLNGLHEQKEDDDAETKALVRRIRTLIAQDILYSEKL